MPKRSDRDVRESRLASGWTVEEGPAAEPGIEQPPMQADPGAEPTPTADPQPRDEREQLGNGTLVLLGVIGGLYLLYTWVWLSWANHYAGLNAELAGDAGVLGSILQQTMYWAAPLAPALWFFSALLLNRGERTWRLALWLVIGAIVLVPLPMFDLGTAA
ncbi:hypothetical protein J4H92_09210 [Leucobacter weissii]|uniref:DNA polymerase III subunit gamma/tau n=1 Tax=Leucobacter weissii TaxID=1983706 RepID=A0A939S690_9MICO|nr:hypothetical protein [Leucobacter weissii]MBO1902124.1 hypothetical protein [Leucobacter weissii]